MKEEKLLKEISKYIESKGWNVLVIGFKGIGKRELKNNFTLMVDFTGKRKATSLPSKKIGSVKK